MFDFFCRFLDFIAESQFVNSGRPPFCPYPAHVQDILVLVRFIVCVIKNEPVVKDRPFR